MDRVRRLADQSNGLQGFLIFHSFGGQKKPVKKSFDLFSQVEQALALHRFSWNVCLLIMAKNPSWHSPYIRPLRFLSAPQMDKTIFYHTQVSTAIVEPYNAVLYTHTTLEHCDCAFLVDNQAIYDLSQKSLGVQTPTYTNLNRIIAQVLSSVTASLR